MVRQHYGRHLRLTKSWHGPAALFLWECPTLNPRSLWERGKEKSRGCIWVPLSAAAAMLATVLLLAATLGGEAYGGEGPVDYRVVDGAILDPLADQPGDPQRGRRMVLDREGGDCVICHAMPLPQREFHGNVGPALDGIGSRATAGVLRLRLVDPKAINPETVMPAYYKVEGLHRVLDRYRGRPILTAQQIEDVIAYLLTLTQE